MPSPNQILEDYKKKIQEIKNEISKITFPPEWTESIEKSIRSLEIQSRHISDIIEKVNNRQAIEKKRLEQYVEIENNMQKEIRNYDKLSEKLTELRDKRASYLSISWPGDPRVVELNLQIDLTEKLIKKDKARIDEFKKHINDVTRLREELEYTTDLKSKINELEKKNIEYGRKNMEQWFGLRQSAFDFLNHAKDISEVFGTITFSLTNIARGMADMVKPGQIMALIYDQTKKLVIELENQAAITAALTARGRIYTNEVYNASIANREFGISLTDTNKAFGDLYSNMLGFTELTPKARQELTKISSQMSLLGVSSSTSSQILNDLTKGLRMSTSASSDTLLEIANLSGKIGIPTSKLAEEFKSTFSQLSVYGKKGMEVFKGLAAAAKITGISISRLNSLFGESMNTFEGSAGVAGKLNSILGRDLLNSVDLLYASEDKRLRMIKESLDVSGRQFKNMNKFEQMAIANAAGITDMGEANKIFNMSLSAYDEAKEKAKQAEASQKAFRKAIEPTVTFMKKLEGALQNFAISVQPVISVVGFLVDAVSKVFEWYGKLNQELGDFLSVVLLISSVMLYRWIATTMAQIASFSTITLGAAGATSTLGASATAAGAAAGTASVGMWAFFAPIAAGIAGVLALTAAIYGLKKLWDWWMGSSKEKSINLTKTATDRQIEYKKSITQTTPELKKYNAQNEAQHKIQTKKRSPALWEMPTVMSDGLKSYRQELIKTEPEIRKTNISSNIQKMSETNNSLYQNKVSTKNETTNNLMNKISALEKKVNTKRQTSPIKIDVNFMDIEATKRNFQNAVERAIEEKYG